MTSGPSAGARCARRAPASRQLVNQPGRLTKVRYRRPGATAWEELELEQAMDMIAERVIAAREAGWQDRDHAATGFLQDLQNADCILIEGSSMAEAHPVAFRWVMKAKERGARIINVDPRYSRTSALADHHVHIWAGTDIAFLGALIRHVLETESYFRDYVVNYTNASTIIDERFRDTEDLGGVFSGFDPQTGMCERSTWAYEGDESSARGGVRENATQSFEDRTGAGMPVDQMRRDETLQDPRCVFQILRRHFSRYTPENVQRICGISPEDFHAVAQALIKNSGRERTTAFCYAVGWTQHTAGAQMIRTAAILQLLLGNIGRPGGGIMALRGHASIQGSTDIPKAFTCDVRAGRRQRPSTERLKGSASTGPVVAPNEDDLSAEYPKEVAP